MSYTYPEALNGLQKVAVDLLQRSYPSVSFNVSVVADTVTGTASVDWRGNPREHRYVRVTIKMPVRPATYRMTDDEFRHWAAYLLHEVGHPNETDMDVWNEAVQTRRSNLLNALEDVREEKCTLARGIAHNGLKVLSELIDMLQARAVASGYDPNSLQSIGWTLSLMGRHANGYAVDVSHVTRKLDPNGIVGRVLAWALPSLDACQSTRDCLDLSERIIQFVRTAQKEEAEAKAEPQPEFEPIDEEPQPQQGLSPVPVSGGPDIPEEDAPAGTETEVEAPAGGEDEEPKQAQDGAMVPGEKTPGPEKEFGDEDIAPVDLQPNQMENMRKGSKDAAVQSRLTHMLRQMLTAERETMTDKMVIGRDRHGSVERVTKNASRMGKQRSLLAQALKRNDLEDYEGGRAHGRLDRRALARMAAGEVNVFGRRMVTEGYDTDVEVLVDGSSSMERGGIEAAASLALVVAQAAAQVGIECTAHVFNDGGLHYAVKGRAKPLARRFAYMINQCKGSTPLTESILRAATMQAKRAPNKRRVLFVVTDGVCNLGEEMVKGAADYVEGVMRTEIANLHIGYAVMGLFRNEVAVQVGKVREAGLRQLAATLERGA